MRQWVLVSAEAEGRPFPLNGHEEKLSLHIGVSGFGEIFWEELS